MTSAENTEARNALVLTSQVGAEQRIAGQATEVDFGGSVSFSTAAARAAVPLLHPCAPRRTRHGRITGQAGGTRAGPESMNRGARRGFGSKRDRTLGTCRELLLPWRLLLRVLTVIQHPFDSLEQRRLKSCPGRLEDRQRRSSLRARPHDNGIVCDAAFDSRPSAVPRPRRDAPLAPARLSRRNRFEALPVRRRGDLERGGPGAIR